MVRGSEREMGGWKDSKRAASVVLEGEQRRGFGDEGRGIFQNISDLEFMYPFNNCLLNPNYTPGIEDTVIKFPTVNELTFYLEGTNR